MAFGNETSKPGDYYSPYYTIRFLASDVPETFTENNEQVGADGAAPASTLKSEDDTEKSKTQFSESEDMKILRAFVTSLVIEGVSSSAYKATVVLAPPYDDAVKILENKLIKFGSVMEIQWGYRGGGGEEISSPIHLFRITQPKCQFGQTTTITLEGRDLHTVTAESRKKAASWARALYGRDIDILRALIPELGNGYSLNTTQLPFTNGLWSAGEGDGYEQKESYARFFRRICDKHNVGWIMRGKEIILFDEDQIGQQPPAYTLLWRRAASTGTGEGSYEIPVTEVTINPLLTLFAGVPAAKGAVTSKTNLDKNKTEQKKLDDTKAPRTSPSPSTQTGTGPQPQQPVATKSTDGAVVADPKLPTNATGDHYTASTREPNADGRLRTEIIRTSQLANTTASVKIPGHPGIHPQMIVSLVGLPRIFSGNYLVRKAKHSLGASYTCELELFSRVASQDQASGDGQRALGARNSVPPEPAGGREPTSYGPDGNPIDPDAPNTGGFNFL